MTVFYLTLVLFFLILTGFAAGKLNEADAGFAKNLSSFLFNMAYRALIIKSMQFSFMTGGLPQSPHLYQHYFP